jgi:HK97 family phage prohead protease
MNKKVFRPTIEFKEGDEKGSFRAVFATFNVRDLDGDVTLPGAFTDGEKVRIAYWGHRWHDLPVGRGVIHADDEKAWVDGKFFLDTQAGMETYKTVKNLAELQEWSYGFDITESESGQFEEQDVRILKKMVVHEVSPVLLGAGIGTMTTDIKGAKDDEESDEDAHDQPPANEAGETDDTDESEAGDGNESDGVDPRTYQTLIDIQLEELS